MPLMQDEISVAANSTSANVLAGELHEFLQGAAQVVLSACGSATGLRVTLTIGGVVLIQRARINLQNRPPVLPDDILEATRANGGRMILTFENVTAGALTAFWRVDVDY